MVSFSTYRDNLLRRRKASQGKRRLGAVYQASRARVIFSDFGRVLYVPMIEVDGHDGSGRY